MTSNSRLFVGKYEFGDKHNCSVQCLDIIFVLYIQIVTESHIVNDKNANNRLCFNKDKYI